MTTHKDVIRIGIDYDEPIFPWYDYAHDVSLAAGLADPDGDPPTGWDPTTTYGCTLQEWFDALNAEVKRGLDGMYARPVKPGVADALRFMYGKGYEIHIVTARGQFGNYGEDIKSLTKSQLVRENIPYTSLTFTESKGVTIKELGLHYFLDDRTVYFWEAKEAGAESYLLNERWNLSDEEVPATRRVDSTQEFLDTIYRQHGDRWRLSASQQMAMSNFRPDPNAPGRITF